MTGRRRPAPNGAEPLIMNAALLPPDQVVPLGRHMLRDVDEPQAVFGLVADQRQVAAR